MTQTGFASDPHVIVLASLVREARVREGHAMIVASFDDVVGLPFVERHVALAEESWVGCVESLARWARS